MLVASSNQHGIARGDQGVFVLGLEISKGCNNFVEFLVVKPYFAPNFQG